MISKNQQINGREWPFLPLIIVYALFSFGCVFLFAFDVIKFRDMLMYLIFLFSIAVLVTLYIRWVVRQEKANKEEQKIEELEGQVRGKPKEPQLLWDLARHKLEQYINRNLFQIRSIFWISVVVLCLGFGLIIYGILISSRNDTLLGFDVSTISGIIMEFVGATFMSIYRSTLNQSSTYFITLSKINTVGMAAQIVDSISDDNTELKDNAKAKLAKDLLNSEFIWTLNNFNPPPKCASTENQENIE